MNNQITESMIKNSLLCSDRYKKIVDTMSIKDFIKVGVFDFKKTDDLERRRIIDWAKEKTDLIPKTIVDFFGESKIKEVYGAV